MFGLIRLPLLVGLAFVAGMLYERSEARTACLAAAGEMRDNLCIGAVRPAPGGATE